MPDSHAPQRDSLAGSAGLPNHQLGEVLGRGAFGCVYRALNWHTGETVAVKQIGLSNIPHHELPEIMSEIDLLRNLDRKAARLLGAHVHVAAFYGKALTVGRTQLDPNVVQYRGFVKTHDCLWIILEYCENGSLTAICKKFGKFPESLCQIYIYQVLEGLLYLHDQGVIHRDIKGSNILATKEGSIKLADFGVATTVGGLDRSVVGSPYWMAPEVVEQSGATTASDIWSVGCVVIELLEGQPPYHDLAPMPALFRIVNDDCPPLPDSASPVVRDFLLQCFQKDGNLRISARKLLKHPWMVSAKRQMDSLKRKHSSSRITEPDDGTNGFEETVAKVQEWNKTLDDRGTSQAPLPTQGKAVARLSEDVVNALQASPKASSKLLESAQRLPTSMRRPLLETSVAPEGALSVLSEREEKDEDDNWDSDFEEGISTAKPVNAKHSPIPPTDDEELEHDDGVTIKASSYTMPLIDKRRHANTSAQTVRPLPAKQRALQVRLMPSPPDGARSPQVRRASSGTTSTRPSSIIAAQPGRHATFGRRSIIRFSDTDEDDYTDTFQKEQAPEQTENKLRLKDRLSSPVYSEHEDTEDEDPFADMDDDLSGEEDIGTDILSANYHRDRVARMCSFVNDLLNGMMDQAEESILKEGCLYLITLLEEFPEIRDHFIRMHGLLTLVEALQQELVSDELVSLELRVINIIVSDDPASLEKICLIGGCPVVMQFSHDRYSRDIRLEAALFIGSMCRHSTSSLQMFISCRGLKTLVDMMDEDYDTQKDLVWMAVDGIYRVFEMPGATPRNDYCRMLSKEGLLEPLSSALFATAHDDDDLAQSALSKIVHIFLLFAQSDLRVKEGLAKASIVSRLVESLTVVPRDSLVPTLKTIKSLSMAPSALDILQQVQTIPMLVQIMTQNVSITEICNPVVNALYNLCRLSKSRQEEAALAGAVPVLAKLVQNNSPLKQFALPVLCDFAHTSETVRQILWKDRMHVVYLDLLQDPFWSLPALESLLSWMQEDLQRIEVFLLKQSSLDTLLQAFVKARSASFENLLEPFLKILRMSAKICIAIATQHASLAENIAERLCTNKTKAVGRLNLLRLTKVILDSRNLAPAHKVHFCQQGTALPPQPADHGHGINPAPSTLEAVVSHLAEKDPSLLVSNLAKELLRDLGLARQQSSGRSTPPSTARPVPASQAAPSSRTNAGLKLPTGAPRIRLRSRPNSPMPSGESQSTGDATRLGPNDKSSLSPLGSPAKLAQAAAVDGQGLPVPQRRKSIRAKISPPR